MREYSDFYRANPTSAYSLLLLAEARLARNQDFLPLKTITITTQSPYSPFNRVMEKSVKNAVFNMYWPFAFGSCISYLYSSVPSNFCL